VPVNVATSSSMPLSSARRRAGATMSIQVLAPGVAVKRTVVVLANVAPSVVAEERSTSTS